MIERLESVGAGGSDDNRGLDHAPLPSHRPRDRQEDGRGDRDLAAGCQRVGTDNIQRNVRQALGRHHRENKLALIVVGAEIEGGSHQALDGGEYKIPVARIVAGLDLHLREVKCL